MPFLSSDLLPLPQPTPMLKGSKTTANKPAEEEARKQKMVNWRQSSPGLPSPLLPSALLKPRRDEKLQLQIILRLLCGSRHFNDWNKTSWVTRGTQRVSHYSRVTKRTTVPFLTFIQGQKRICLTDPLEREVRKILTLSSNSTLQVLLIHYSKVMLPHLCKAC